MLRFFLKNILLPIFSIFIKVDKNADNFYHRGKLHTGLLQIKGGNEKAALKVIKRFVQDGTGLADPTKKEIRKAKSIPQALSILNFESDENNGIITFQQSSNDKIHQSFLYLGAMTLLNELKGIALDGSIIEVDDGKETLYSFMIKDSKVHEELFFIDEEADGSYSREPYEESD